jgi:hypothetical protein
MDAGQEQQWEIEQGFQQTKAVPHTICHLRHGHMFPTLPLNKYVGQKKTYGPDWTERFGM